MKLDKLTIELQVIGDKLIASCQQLSCRLESGIPVEDSIWEHPLIEMKRLVESELLQLKDNNQIESTELLEALLPEEVADHIRYQEFIEKLESAFVKAYPKAKGHWNVRTLIPSFDWTDPELEVKEKAAYESFISEGANSKLWIEWIDDVTTTILPLYRESDRLQVYQRWQELGLPIKSYEEIAKLG